MPIIKINVILYLSIIALILTTAVACATSDAPTANPQDSSGPTVKISSSSLDDNRVLEAEPNEEIVLTTLFTGEDLTFQWSVDGRGSLQKTEELKGIQGQSNRYTAPEGSTEQVLEEVVSVTVTDGRNRSVNDQIIIRVGSNQLLASNPPGIVTNGPQSSTSPGARQAELKLFKEKFSFTQRGPLRGNRAIVNGSTVELEYDFSTAGRWFGAVFPVEDPGLIKQYEYLRIQVLGDASFEIKPNDLDMTNLFRRGEDNVYEIDTDHIIDRFGEMRELVLVVTPRGDIVSGSQTFILSVAEPRQ